MADKAKFSLDGYVDVAERIRQFRDKFPDGSLQPLNLEKPFIVSMVEDQTFVIYTAAAYRTPDDPRPGVGVAWEPYPGRTPYTKDSEVMNAETSAWGRAIVAALAADTQKIASAQEVRNRAADEEAGPEPTVSGARRATDKQKQAIERLVNVTGLVVAPWPLPDDLTMKVASSMLDLLKAEPAKDETVVRRGADPDAVAVLQEQVGAEVA